MNRIYVLLFLFASFCKVFGQENENTSKHFEISKNLEIFTTLYKEVQSHYVNEIDPGEFMKTGIDAMLSTLDPYTVYIPESDIENARMYTSGEYGGIGTEVIFDKDYCIVREPYFGKPAYNSGIRAGDTILQVNGKSVKGKDIYELSSILRGQAGTTVQVELTSSAGEHKSVNIKRENIKISAVPYAGNIDDDYGYIRFTSFTRSSGDEFKKALQKLKDENPAMKGLIIDIRGNGGGLLSEAVKIVNLFVPKGEKVVEVKGRKNKDDQAYRTTSEPVDTGIPLTIIVNGHSASASEILSGAIQDLDRGVIIGERTFGKGLVQNVIPLVYNAQLKVTVAKYYIPSGRCIQEIDYKHKNEDGTAVKMNDSTRHVFYSKNHRPFYNNGGIQPDIHLQSPEASGLLSELRQKHLFFKYALRYQLQHDSIAPPSTFTVSDKVFEDFLGFLKEEHFEYQSGIEKKLTEIQHICDSIQDTTFSQSISKLLSEEKAKKDQIFEKYKKDLKRILRIEIATLYYFQRGKIIATLKGDSFIDAAKEVIDDSTRYHSILQPQSR